MATAATIRKDTSEGPGRIRQPAADRRKAILAAARDVFLERGYANSSIDAVVERSGGSKATVYQLFGNKEGLLAALVADGAEELAHLVDALPHDGELEQSLRAFARGYLGLVLRPERLGLFRLVIGECGRVPEIGDVFYRSGPQSCGKGMTRFFAGVMARGLTRNADPERTAYQFIHALRGDLYMQVLLNPTRAPTRTRSTRISTSWCAISSTVSASSNNRIAASTLQGDSHRTYVMRERIRCLCSSAWMRLPQRGAMDCDLNCALC